MIHYKLEDIERAERNIRRKGRYFRTQKELAAIIGVSVSTLHNWMNDGTIELKKQWRKTPLKMPKSMENERIFYFDRLYYDAIDVLNQLKG